MTFKKIATYGMTSALGAAVLLATPALAQVGAVGSVGVNASVGTANVSAGADASANAGKGSNSTATQTRIMTAADTEIANRIQAMTTLTARLNGMKNLSGDEKTTFSNELQAQISDMTNLQTEIAGATSTASLRAYRQSITGDYRIYALIMPQASILAAVDRVNTIVGMMTALGTKLQGRIASASTTASASAETSLADFNAKVSDATTQGAAAQAEVTGLTPDQGNKTELASNTAALKDARAKLQAASKDLVAARADAAAILKDLKITISATASSTVTTQ